MEWSSLVVCHCAPAVGIRTLGMIQERVPVYLRSLPVPRVSQFGHKMVALTAVGRKHLGCGVNTRYVIRRSAQGRR